MESLKKTGIKHVDFTGKEIKKGKKKDIILCISNCYIFITNPESGEIDNCQLK
jgi:hypothetical protein